MPQLGPPVTDPALLARLGGGAPAAGGAATQPGQIPGYDFIPNPATAKEHKRQLDPDEVKRRGLDASRVWVVSDVSPDAPIDAGPASPEAVQEASTRRLLKAAGVDLTGGVDPVSPLIEGSTSGGLQNIGRNVAGFFGVSTPGAEAIGQLEAIINDLTMQLTPNGSLGAQISNTDRDFMVARLGDVANASKPAGVRLAAWEQVKQRMANTLGVQIAPRAPTPGAEPPTGLEGKELEQPAPPRGGEGPGDIGFSGNVPPEVKNPLNPQQQAAYDAFMAANPEATEAQIKAFGESINVNIENADEIVKKRPKAGVAPASEAKPGLTAEEKAYIEEGKRRAGATGAAVKGATDAATLGASDKIASAVTALGQGGDFGANYERNLLVGNAYDEALRQAHPAAYMGGEFAGGALLPMGSARGVGNLMRAGAAYGGAYGLGSSDTLAEAPINFLTGATMGGVGGLAAAPVARGFDLAGGALARGATNRAARRNQQFGPQEYSPEDIGLAFQQEGIPAAQVMAFPERRGEMAAMQARRGSQGVVEESVEATRQGIGRRVEEIGQAGRAAPSPGEAGEAVRGAVERGVEQTHARATRHYTRAAELAGDDPVTGTEALTRLDRHIADLSRNENTNSGVLGYLRRVRRDLVETTNEPVPDLYGNPSMDEAGNPIMRQVEGGPRAKTVAEIRDLRTNVAGEINRENLGHTNAERIMEDVLAGARADIERDLSRSNPRALELYRRGDTLWQRMTTDRRQLLEGLTGPANNPHSGEKVMERVRGMMGSKGDMRKFDRIMNMMTPEERANFGANLFEHIGRESPESDFSPARFLTATKDIQMPQLRRVFGDDAARSIQNLRVASSAFKATAAHMNRGSAVANNFRTVMESVLGRLSLGGGAAGVGALAGGAGGIATAATALGGGLAAEGATRLWNGMSARSLMNPDVGRWMRRAAQARNPRDYERLMGELGTIAAKDATLAPEITGLRDFISTAMNEATGMKEPEKKVAGAR